MADFKSLLKGAVTSALNSNSDTTTTDSELDLSKVSSAIDMLISSKGIIESKLGDAGTKVVDAATNVKKVIEAGEANELIKKALGLLQDALEKVQGNAICATVAKKLEEMGV